MKKLFDFFEESFSFDSIAIKQKKCVCDSRSDVDTSSEIIKGVVRKIPLIVSNMSSVINSDFYIKVYNLGAFAILHRALGNEEYFSEVKKVAKNCEHVAVSIGLQEELAAQLISCGANIITIDVANAYSDNTISLGRFLKKKYPHIKLIIGNTTCLDIMYEIQDFADALKVGVAQGLACSTKDTAGITEHMFSAIFKFKQASKELGIPIISDGSIKEPHHFVKAISCANSAMAGSIFARCPESAAETITIDNEIKKRYYGMMSMTNQIKWFGKVKNDCPEGKEIHLPIGQPVKDLLNRYVGALRSGITHSSGYNIKSFQENVEFVILK